MEWGRVMKKIITVLMIIMPLMILKAQTFTEINTGLQGSEAGGTIEWGDCDNDGDLDVLFSTPYISDSNLMVWRNDSGIFTGVQVISNDGQPYIGATWGDYDNDGHLDILLSGKSLVIRNNGDGTFSNAVGIAGEIYWSGGEWGDYDNDGDLDIILAGEYAGEGTITRIYNNENENFTDIQAGLPGVYHPSFDWGDYDNDCDLDLAITGVNDSGGSEEYNWCSHIFRNDSGVFTDISAGLDKLIVGSIRWGDYDNDGDLDLVHNGYGSNKSSVYKNTGGVFQKITTDIAGGYGRSEWGDIDCDGDLDMVFAGSDTTYVYKNNSGAFSDTKLRLKGIGASDSFGGLSLGDYDNDGDLDIIITGPGYTKLYRNDSQVANTAPFSPSNLNSAINGNNASLSWNKAIDNETLQNGLTYNLYFRIDGSDKILNAPMSDISTGYRKIAHIGNSNNNSGWTVKNLSPGEYYWSVQAVDNNFTGSAFAPEAVFNIPLMSPEALNASGVGGGRFTAVWSDVPYADNYTLDVSESESFSTFIPGYENFSAADINSLTVTGLSEETVYYYRVKSYYDEFESGYSNTVSVQTGLLPQPPTATDATVIDEQSFTANWLSVPDAISYSIDVSTDVNFGSFVSGYENKNVGNVLSFTVTGLGSYTDYYYRLRSNSGIEQSVPGNSITVKTDIQAYTPVSFNLTGVKLGDSKWGDYNNDGDLDIIITGNTGTEQITKIYRNDAGEFVDINADILGLYNSSLALGDYDNDGDLDILITGYTGTEYITRIYKNDSGVFTDSGNELESSPFGSVAWGDYDNDGELDFAFSGYTFSDIFKNDDGNFSRINSGLPALGNGTVRWGDIDSDNDLDILINGNTGSEYITRIYRNDEGVFTDINAGLKGVYNGSTDLGDFDSDGDLDIIITGTSSEGPLTQIYRNDDSLFTAVGSSMPGLSYGSASWGDLDNDGNLDVVLCGETVTGLISDIYMYQNGNYVYLKSYMTPVSLSSNDTGDYDKNGSLDIILSGYTGSEYISTVYRNNFSTEVIVLSPPESLSEFVDGENITFEWNKPEGVESKSSLTYNIYIGTESRTGNIMSPLSNIDSGVRIISGTGNTGINNSWVIKGLEPGRYYWSVQTIDPAYNGSIFATERIIDYMGIEENIPLTTELFQNYPNPFNPVTAISYALLKTAQVELNVYNLQGQLVQALVNGKQVKGIHKAEFNGSDLTSGMYIYSLKVDGKSVQSKKMMMLK